MKLRFQVEQDQSCFQPIFPTELTWILLTDTLRIKLFARKAIIDSMTGQTTFLTGAALICLPNCADAIYSLSSGGPWIFPAIGAGLAVNLAYCAWRGELWAYYLLLFLNCIGLALTAVVFLAVSGIVSIIVLVSSFFASCLGMGMIVIPDGSKKFMSDQRLRFRSQQQK